MCGTTAGIQAENNYSCHEDQCVESHVGASRAACEATCGAPAPPPPPVQCTRRSVSVSVCVCVCVCMFAFLLLVLKFLLHWEPFNTQVARLKMLTLVMSHIDCSPIQLLQSVSQLWICEVDNGTHTKILFNGRYIPSSGIINPNVFVWSILSHWTGNTPADLGIPA